MRLIWSGVAATLILLSGCANVTFESVEAPSWQSGYAFTYELEGTMEANAVADVPGQPRQEEHEQESFGPVDAYSFEVISTRGTGDTYIAAFAVHDSIGGLLDVPTVAGIRHDDLTLLPGSIDGTTIRLKGSGAVDLAFPLEPGKTWRYDMPSVPPGMEDEGIGDLAVSAKATRSLQVAVEDQTIEVIEVVHTLRAPGLQELVKEARADMREQGVDGSLSATFSGQRVLLYSPDLEAVVSDVTQVRLKLDMKVTFDGETMTVNADSSAVTHLRLVGIDRLPEADRDMAEAVHFLASGQPIETPGVVELPGEAYPLAINQSAPLVNAAQTPTVRFTAVGSVPEGSTLHWTVRDAGGQRVDGGEGDRFDLTVQDPGAYGILLEGRDADGRLGGASSTVLIADYHGDVPIVCGPVAVTPPAGPLACDDASLDVPAGLRGFTLQFDANAPGGVGPGTYRVSDGASTAEVATQDGTAKVDAGDGVGLAPGGWTMQWQPTIGVAHEPTVTVSLDYGGASGTDATQNAFRMLERLDLPVGLTHGPLAPLAQGAPVAALIHGA